MAGLERVTAPTLDVLEVLVQAWVDEVELHRWAIMKAAARSGPTVYGILDRLEDQGWVTGQWEEQEAGVSRPRRRYYRLTPTGAAEARSLLTGRKAAAQGAMRDRKPLPGHLARIFNRATRGVA